MIQVIQLRSKSTGVDFSAFITSGVCIFGQNFFAAFYRSLCPFRSQCSMIFYTVNEFSFSFCSCRYRWEGENFVWHHFASGRRVTLKFRIFCISGFHTPPTEGFPIPLKISVWLHTFTPNPPPPSPLEFLMAFLGGWVWTFSGNALFIN